MGGRGRKGRCGRREQERGRVGGREVGENLPGGSMRREKWEAEGTSRIHQEDIGAMNTNIGMHEFWNEKLAKLRRCVFALRKIQFGITQFGKIQLGKNTVWKNTPQKHLSLHTGWFFFTGTPLKSKSMENLG